MGRNATKTLKIDAGNWELQGADEVTGLYVKSFDIFVVIRINLKPSNAECEKHLNSPISSHTLSKTSTVLRCGRVFCTQPGFLDHLQWSWSYCRRVNNGLQLPKRMHGKIYSCWYNDLDDIVVGFPLGAIWCQYLQKSRKHWSGKWFSHSYAMPCNAWHC